MHSGDSIDKLRRAQIKHPNAFLAEYAGRMRLFVFEDRGLTDGEFVSAWRPLHPSPAVPAEGWVHRVPETVMRAQSDPNKFRYREDNAAMLAAGLLNISS